MIRAIALVFVLGLSGCAMLRAACRPEQLVPMHGGGYRVIAGECPK